MEERVCHHRARRGPEWTTVEEPLRPGGLEFTGRVVLLDCVTLWLTNLFFEAEAAGADSPEAAAETARNVSEAEFERLTASDATYIFVTNEVGLGGVAPDSVARAFADLQGHVNQFIAARADEVTLVVSGIPVKIK